MRKTIMTGLRRIGLLSIALTGLVSSARAEEPKLIALTFDDGPNTTTTMEMLDVLEENGVVGTFFLIGQNINTESEKSVRRALELGCDIECHSWTHPAMDKLSPEEIRREVQNTNDKIASITGRKPMFFRPPFIAVSQTMHDNIDETFICGAGCEDWIPTVTAEERYDKVMAQARDGLIVLLHDMPGNTATVEAVKMLIPGLKSQGYEFVTVEQLFSRKGITPRKNVVYTDILHD